MKRILIPSLIALLVITLVFLIYRTSGPKKTEAEILYEQRKKRKAEKAEFREARLRYEFEMLKDPVTGKIPKGIFEKEILFARTLPVRGEAYNPAARGSGIAVQNSYLAAGPNNVGGRTRALAYDKRYNGTTNRVIIAGCVSGGIMRSADGGSTWNLVTPEGDVHNFTAIVQDPRPGSEDVWYAGGGEAYGNTTTELGATYLGDGLWKSTNNGVTWAKLPLTNIREISGAIIPSGSLEAFDHPFDYVHAISVNPVNGHVYVAGHRRLLRSTDGGNSFQTIFGSATQANPSNGQMDLAINNTGRIFLAVNGGNPDRSLRGIWTSNTGNVASFVRIAGGQTLGVDSIPGWRANSVGDSARRILIRIAPSEQASGYVFYFNGGESEAAVPHPEGDFFKFQISNNTYTWTNRSANMPDLPNNNLAGSDPVDLQDGYNMLLEVKPDDPNTVFVGGTNLYRSTTAFATSNNTTWINGYSTSFNYQPYPNGHPDIHALVFNPSNTAQSICGDDGGIRITNNVMTSSVLWSPLPNYQTLQYYFVAADPGQGRNNFVGGAQDNGTQLRDKLRVMGTAIADSNNHVRLLGGDGGAVGLSRLNPDQTQYVYATSQNGVARRLRIAPSVQTTDIRPNGLTGEDEEFGEFVTNLRLNPDNTEDLYYANYNRLFRTAAASTVTPSTWTELTGVRQAINPSNPTDGKDVSIRALAFSRGAYIPTHSLFIGTTNGRIFRLDDPRNTTPNSAPVNITPIGLQGNVQDIAVNPINDNEILAVVSNYNTTSIWWTGNAKSASPSWRNAEGNLTLPSVRSCEIIVNNSGGTPVTEYYVGTSVGLYSAVDLATSLPGGSSPTWEREGSNVLNFAVVQSMDHRTSDNLLLIGTHGNGMFYSFVGQSGPGPNPNPGTENVFIELLAPTITNADVTYQIGNLTTVQKIVIRIFNTKGQLMFKEERAYENGPAINLERYAAGVYIVSIMSDDGKHKFTQKVVKQ